MEFEIGYTDKEITPWGGMVFMRQMLDKIGFRKVINAQGDLPVPALTGAMLPVLLLKLSWLVFGAGQTAFYTLR